jgi:hypothetical protein
MPPCGTFRYRGVVPSNWPHNRTWSVHDASDAIRTPASDSLRAARLVGLNPTVEVGDQDLSLRAESRQRALVRTAVLPFTDALVAAMATGDELWLVRTNTADLGLSLIRGGGLVFAVGAVSQVPVGSQLRVSSGGDPGDHLFRSSFGEGSAHPIRDTWIRDTCLEVGFGDQTVRLRSGDRASLGTYEAYVLESRQDNVPGTHETAAVLDSGSVPLEPVIQFLPRIRDRQSLKMISHATGFRWFWGG